jgi:hypothetical protein
VLQFVHGNYINGLSVCAARTLYTRYGLFDQRYRYAHDVERWFSFFRREEAAFIDGPIQSHTRLNTGNTADADLLGELDVLKMLCRALQERGLQGLLPEQDAAPVLPPAILVEVLERLFHPANLFYRFHLRHHLIDLVAQGLRGQAERQGLRDAVGLVRTRGNDTHHAELLAALDQVGALLEQPDPVRPQSFVERISELKGRMNVPEQREVLDRFLRVGF